MQTPVICFPHCGFLSETSRMVAIYRKLVDLGIPARIATHGGIYEFVLKEEEITYDTVEPITSHEDCQHCLRVMAKPWIDLYDKSTLNKMVISELNYYKSNNAAAVITGFQLSTALSARGAKIPLIVTHLGSFVPPIMEKGMFYCSEYFDNLLTKLIPNRVINRFFAAFFMRLPAQKKVFNSVADELSIERIHSLFELMMGDLTLVTDVPEILGIPEAELEFWKPSNTKYFRPSLRLKYAGPIFARLFGQIPDNVYSFLKTEKPKIYVAMASGDKENMQRVYDTISGMNLRAVFCSLANFDIFKSTDNILVADFLPSHLVMPLCDLAIIHGGQGSVQTAIASGTPLIGFPIQPEQNFNLKQVERHGAGLCLSLKSLRKGHLEDSINQILNDSKYKKSMEQLKAWQSRRDGALEVAKIVKSLI
jgi:UDP:flavonoid glycosyltransferase YjiC (YdhE family)